MEVRGLIDAFANGSRPWMAIAPLDALTNVHGDLSKIIVELMPRADPWHDAVGVHIGIVEVQRFV